MTPSAALPFTLRRSDDVISGGGITTTTETIHGLLRLVDDRLLVQWRLARKTDHIGGEIRSDEEVEAVRQVAIPLEGIASAVVRHRWWQGPGGSRLELTASDLRVFEEIAGQAGLRMTHPAQLVLKVGRRDRLAAEEFAADLVLALAKQSLSPGVRYRGLQGLEEDSHRLPEGNQQPE